MAMTLVSTVTATTTLGFIEFTNVPQTGKDLLVLFSARDTGSSGSSAGISLFLNGSSSNFTIRRLTGDGSAVTSVTEANPFNSGFMPNNGATANTFGNGLFYISNYTSAANKSFSGDSVTENNATAARQNITAGLWANAAAITSVRLDPTISFATGTTASLYIIS